MNEEQECFFYLSLSNTVGRAIFDHNGLMHGKHFRCEEVGHMTVILFWEDMWKVMWSPICWIYGIRYRIGIHLRRIGSSQIAADIR